jgi:hypothetical protein
MLIDALAQADACMSQIFFETSAVPELMKVFEQLKTDASGASDLVSANVKKMGEIATRCAIRVDIFLHRITDAMDALFELLEATPFAFEIEEVGETSAETRERLEASLSEVVQKCQKKVDKIKKNAEVQVPKLMEALKKSGYAAEISNRILLGTCEAGSEAKKFIDRSKRSRLSESYIKDQHVILWLEKERMRKLQVESQEFNEQLLWSTEKLVKTMSELSSFNRQETECKLPTACLNGLSCLYMMKKKQVELPVLFRTLAFLVKTSHDLPVGICTAALAHAVANVCCFINAEAEYYCQVSQKHFMPLANKLGSLIFLNSEEWADQIDQEKIELKEEAEAMQKRIEVLVARHNERNDARAERLMAENERIFKEYVPDVSEEKKVELKDLAQWICDMTL